MRNLNNFWVVFSHTFVSKVKRKQFIITTLTTLVVILLLANMASIIEFFTSLGDKEQETVVVVDETGELGPLFVETLSHMNEDIHVEIANTDETAVKERAMADEIKGYIVLQLDENGMFGGTYKAKSLTDFWLQEQMHTVLQQIKMVYMAQQMNLSPEQLNLLNEPVRFDQETIVEGGKTQEELSQARGLVYVLLFVIYFSVFLYANMIATEVATEKSSRVMEILISSVSPVAQMFGKILGVGLVGLTQMVIWLGCGYWALKRNLDEMHGEFFTVFGFEQTSLTTIVYAIIFFILGFFLYATMAALFGSLASRTEDVPQLIAPMSWLVVLGFLFATFGSIFSPDATFLAIVSYIPFFTPMVMFMRVGILDLPFWEPLLGITLMIISIVILGIFAARVYKGGVLMYGNTSSLKDIKTALQLGKRNS